MKVETRRTIPRKLAANLELLLLRARYFVEAMRSASVFGSQISYFGSRVSVSILGSVSFLRQNQRFQILWKHTGLSLDV